MVTNRCSSISNGRAEMTEHNIPRIIRGAMSNPGIHCKRGVASGIEEVGIRLRIIQGGTSNLGIHCERGDGNPGRYDPCHIIRGARGDLGIIGYPLANDHSVRSCTTPADAASSVFDIFKRRRGDDQPGEENVWLSEALRLISGVCSSCKNARGCADTC